MNDSAHILLLDPFHGGSHAAWSQGVREGLTRLGHRVELHTLPANHWKWRMQGAAAIWAHRLQNAPRPDVLLTTDMCDLAQLKGLLPATWHDVKCVVMFHENQLTFPWSPTDQDPNLGRDLAYSYINVSSALAADQVWFNSAHHRDVFLEAIDLWMSKMPKPRLPQPAARIAARSHVVRLGLDFEGWDALKPNAATNWTDCEVPVLLWNQRWSWDKGTDAWMNLVHGILEQGIPAKFVVLGESKGRLPDGWEAMRDKMGTRCLQWGYADSKSDYVQWLWRSTAAPLAPKQEYFGLAMVEAMRCEVMPWVPESHAYTETMPEGHRFMPPDTWIGGLRDQVWKTWPLPPDAYRQKAASCAWGNVIPDLDLLLRQAVAS